MEITQIKGDSETHPVLSPTDEFADFETWNDWAGPPKPGFVPEDTAAFAARKRGSYARAALQTGLKFEAELGIIPFKLGFIGSTDSHASLSTPDEDNFWGKWAIGVPSAERVSMSAYGWSMSTAGLAAVWATGNTREALFEAMKRREVYATTGSRMTVRFLAGGTLRMQTQPRGILPGLAMRRECLWVVIWSAAQKRSPPASSSAR
jgi:hypothetical protein